MNLDQLFILVERLRKDAIGEPKRIDEKDAFEYQDHSAKVVAVLKLIRAAQGITALNLLCHHGLFLDFGAITRCVYDCVDEVHFLLEKFPNTSDNVDKFVKSFFASTIDGYLSNETPSVPAAKIRSATVRIFNGRHDEKTREMMDRIYKTFCGYVHSNYANIMEIYNGGTCDFNLAGVPSLQERQIRMAQLEECTTSVLYAAAFIARTLGLKDLCHEIMRLDAS